MSTSDQPSEDELRAAYEAEIKKIHVEQVVLEQVVSLINLGMRRTGLAPGTEDERDIEQVRVAIEAVRALLPLAEAAAGPQAGQLRDALSQLQLAYVRLGGAPPEAGAAGQTGPPPATSPEAGGAATDAQTPGEEPAQPETPPGTGGEGGPAQRSGRLWVPGQ
jgi:hypothetical protein